MSHTPTDAQLAIGMRVGEYRILEAIGRGGMGTVYRATQPELGNLVAIKVINASLAADPVAVKRFHREARLVSRLRHPNIVSVFSFGRLDDGRRYYVMELLEGRSLRQQLRQHGALTPPRTVTVLSSVAAALSTAHASGIIHRDLKPENIFLPQRASDPVKLLDFGIAKLIAPDAEGVTRTNQQPGSPRYMAPEQCLGRTLDHRADIYSLGLVAFECLVGRSPYAGKTFGEVILLHQKPPPRLRDYRADLPRGLDALFARVLSRDPASRPDDALDVVAELSLLCGTEHDSAPWPAAGAGAAVAAPQQVREVRTGDPAGATLTHGRTPRRAWRRRGVWAVALVLGGLSLLSVVAMLLVYRPSLSSTATTPTAAADVPPSPAVTVSGPEPDLAVAAPPDGAPADGERDAEPLRAAPAKRRPKAPPRRRRRGPPRRVRPRPEPTAPAGEGPLIRF